jgi:hypothetical protein
MKQGLHSYWMVIVLALPYKSNLHDLQNSFVRSNRNIPEQRKCCLFSGIDNLPCGMRINPIQPNLTSVGSFFVRTMLVVFLIIASTTTTFAITYTWRVTTGGSWAVATNWTPTGIPANGDDVIINSNQSADITEVPAITLRNMTVSGNCTLSASFNGNLLTITGTFTITAGTTLTMGTTLQRIAFSLPVGATGIVNGNFAYDAGIVTRLFTVDGTLIVSPTGRVYDPLLSTGSVFILDPGATLQIGNVGGISTAITLNTTVAINFGGSYTYSSGANYVYNGNAAQVTGIGLNQNIPANLTINNPAGVTLTAATTISGVLTLTNGIFTTTPVNLLSLTNSAVTAIVGGSTTAFINGPVRWKLPTNLVSGSTYNFPVGATATYLPFSLVNPTTGAGNVTAQVQAFNGNSGGTTDVTLSSLSTTEYWSLVTAGNFTNSSVSLTRQTPIAPLDAIGGSNTLNGIYTSRAGTAGIFGVANSTAIGTNRFFRPGGKETIHYHRRNRRLTFLCRGFGLRALYDNRDL